MTNRRKMRFYGVNDLQNAESRSHWAALVKDKLIPLHLLLPVTSGVHEWTPVFRDLVFDMAGFLRDRNPSDLIGLAQEFRRDHWREYFRSFSDEEMALLLLKAHDYDLLHAT